MEVFKQWLKDRGFAEWRTNCYEKWLKAPDHRFCFVDLMLDVIRVGYVIVDSDEDWDDFTDPQYAMQAIMQIEENDAQ
jgi:hypothetical protein